MAINYYRIPVTNIPSYFRIGIGGKEYTLTFTWNRMFKYWIMDISDSSGTALVFNSPVITGADLTAKFKYLGLPPIFATTTFNPNLPPDQNNFGNQGQLWTYTKT